MREYGQIQCAFWTSEDVSEMSDIGKLLMAYLLTGPHSNGIGCYRLTNGYLMDDLKWLPETVEKGFAELYRNGLAYRIETVVLIPKFLAWNQIANGNVAKARQVEFESLPKGQAKTEAAQALLTFGKHFSESFRNHLETITQTLPESRQKRYGNQDPTPPDPNHTRTLPEKADRKTPKIAVPEWIDQEAFAGFSEMRLKIKKPMTERAAKLVFGKLERFRDDGKDVTAILNQSTLNCWQDVYELKAPQSNGKGQHRESLAEQGERELRTAGEVIRNGGSLL